MPPLLRQLVALFAPCVVALCLSCSGDQGPEQPEPTQTPTDLGAGGQVEEEQEPTDPDSGPFTSACADAVSSTPGLVTTSVGDILGVQEPNGVWRFLGIPFAEPPVGDLRWRPPVAPGCLEQRPFVADTFGPRCPQLVGGSVDGDEDCLQLNVWTPEDYGSDAQLPVLFYIHGGANVLGSASDGLGPERPVYTGRFLAEQEEVVVVTVQYRLGPLGFLALPELSAESEHGGSGHYAHLDQLLALQWVQDNISRFGGDPQRVLLFGQSAGAINTCALLASPLARGLFSSAAMQSGFCSHQTLDAAQTQHNAGVELFDECRDTGDRMGCLRALSADRVVSTIPGSIAVGTGESVDGGEGMVYGPVVEGYLLPAPPLDLIEAGEHNDVPFVLGSTADEMASDAIFDEEVETVEEYEAQIAEDFAAFGEDAVETILHTYPASDFETPQAALIRVYTDLVFTRNARRVARVAATGGSAPTYRYLFSNLTDTQDGTLPARHGIDVLYVFNSLVTVPALTPGPDDTALAQAMMASWAALARSGDPNTAAVGVSWQPYDAALDNYIDFSANVSVGEGLRTQECDMWDTLIAP